MKHCQTVRLSLLRHVPISAASAGVAAVQKPMQPMPQEIQVYSEMRSDQLHQLQYQIMVLRYLQGRRMPDQNVGVWRGREAQIITNALGIRSGYAQQRQKPVGVSARREG